MMGGETTQYIRSRNMKRAGAFVIYDGLYAIRNIAKDFSLNGQVTLDVVQITLEEIEK